MGLEESGGSLELKDCIGGGEGAGPGEGRIFRVKGCLWNKKCLTRSHFVSMGAHPSKQFKSQPTKNTDYKGQNNGFNL